MIRRITLAFMLSLFLVACVRPVATRISTSTGNPISTQASGDALITATNTLPPPASTKTQSPPATSTPTKNAASPSGPVVTASPTILPEPTQTPLPEASLQYVVQPGTPVGIPNSALPGAGCDFSGLGGQAFGPDGNPQSGLLVEVAGTLYGTQVQAVVLTGAAPDLGPGGFSVKLHDRPVASQSSLSVQLFDLDGKALSAPVSFDTYSDCEKNLTLVNFTAASNVSAAVKIHFPYIAGP